MASRIGDTFQPPPSRLRFVVLMFGWRITGRWTGGGSTAEETFILATRTREREELLVKAGRHLLDRCVSATPGLTGKVSLEVIDTEELGPVSTESAGFSYA
jgi:hypothetical protein